MEVALGWGLKRSSASKSPSQIPATPSECGCFGHLQCPRGARNVLGNKNPGDLSSQEYYFGSWHLGKTPWKITAFRTIQQIRGSGVRKHHETTLTKALQDGVSDKLSEWED